MYNYTSNKIYANFITEQRLQKLKPFCDNAIIEGVLRRICSENFILLKVFEVDFLIPKPFVLWLRTRQIQISQLSCISKHRTHTDTVVVCIKKTYATYIPPISESLRLPAINTYVPYIIKMRNDDEFEQNSMLGICNLVRITRISIFH